MEIMLFKYVSLIIIWIIQLEFYLWRLVLPFLTFWRRLLFPWPTIECVLGMIDKVRFFRELDKFFFFL